MLKREVKDYLLPVILVCPCFFFIAESSFNRIDTFCSTVGHQFIEGTSLICLDSRSARLRTNSSSVMPKELNAGSM